LQTDGGNAGGNWNNTSNAGLGYRNANNERSNTNNNIGFRSALPFMQEGAGLRACIQAMEKEPTSRQDRTLTAPGDKYRIENAAEAPFVWRIDAKHLW